MSNRRISNDPQERNRLQRAMKKFPSVLVITYAPYHLYRCKTIKMARRVQGNHPGSKMYRIKKTRGSFLWKPTK